MEINSDSSSTPSKISYNGQANLQAKSSNNNGKDFFAPAPPRKKELQPPITTHTSSPPAKKRTPEESAFDILENKKYSNTDKAQFLGEILKKNKNFNYAVRRDGNDLYGKALLLNSSSILKTLTQYRKPSARDIRDFLVFSKSRKLNEAWTFLTEYSTEQLAADAEDAALAKLALYTPEYPDESLNITAQLKNPALTADEKKILTFLDENSIPEIKAALLEKNIISSERIFELLRIKDIENLDPTNQTRGTIPLIRAVANNDILAVKALLALDANIENENAFIPGYMPLFFAAILGHESVLRLLIKQKANLSPLFRNRGASTLAYVLKTNHPKTARMLLGALSVEHFAALNGEQIRQINLIIENAQEVTTDIKLVHQEIKERFYFIKAQKVTFKNFLANVDQLNISEIKQALNFKNIHPSLWRHFEIAEIDKPNNFGMTPLMHSLFSPSSLKSLINRIHLLIGLGANVHQPIKFNHYELDIQMRHKTRAITYEVDIKTQHEPKAVINGTLSFLDLLKGSYDKDIFNFPPPLRNNSLGTALVDIDLERDFLQRIEAVKLSLIASGFDLKTGEF